MKCYNLAVMANPSAAPKSTPHSIKSEDAQTPPNSPDPNEVMYQQNLFLVTVLNMSWQLAIGVIVPIVGGYKLDEHYDTKPWLTIVGFVIAAAATFVIMKVTVAQATKKAMHEDTKGSKK